MERTDDDQAVGRMRKQLLFPPLSLLALPPLWQLCPAAAAVAFAAATAAALCKIDEDTAAAASATE